MVEALRLELAARANPRNWIERNLFIRTKLKTVVPLRLNNAQVDYYEHRTNRDIILKPRQLGFTTLVSALYFADCILRPNTVSVLVAHDIDSTEKIFGIVQMFWQHLPDDVKAKLGRPEYANRREFKWPGNGSSFFVGTAGSGTFGHGLTINNLHCSEVSRWKKPDETLIGLLEAVPEGGRVVMESTANGVGNYFHDLWVAAADGQSDYAPQFYTWWEEPEYRMAGEPLGDLSEDEKRLRTTWGLDDDQLRWRRSKLRTLRDHFDEQYPENWMTCFLASGRCCFDLRFLTALAKSIAAAPRARVLPSLRRRERETSFAPATVAVWQDPVPGRAYVIGADIGEGLAEGDASCAYVMDVDRGEEVAELHGRVAPDRFGELLAALGWHYNTALLAVERNNHGHSTLNTLRNVMHYPRLYYHVSYDQVGKAKPRLGWPTDAATKPILVDDLVSAVVGGQLKVHSGGFVEEAMTFVTTDTGSQEAMEGKHDDRVIAMGIAWQARKRGKKRVATGRPEGW
jgi:hypothetical protein